MRRTSLADAKAHLSELVDDVERRGKRILLLRNGKPAAAIVPVVVAMAKPPKPKAMTAADAKAFLDELAQVGDPDGEAVRDLIESR